VYRNIKRNNIKRETRGNLRLLEENIVALLW
jgi:hypothetical protein